MKVSPFPLLLLLPLLAAGLGGCLRSEESVHLALDGSGRIDQVVLLDEEGRASLVKALADLYDVPEAKRGRLRCDPLAAGWLRTRAAGVRGYRLLLLEDTEKEKPFGRRILVQGVFTSLAAAARGGAFLGAGLRLERTREHHWRFELRDGWGWIGDDDRGEIGGIALAKVRERLTPFLQEGGRIERTMVFPTKVIDTNGKLAADGITVRWRFDLVDLLGESVRTSWATFEASDELVLESCRVDPDPTRLLERLLEAPPVPRRVESAGTQAPAK